MNEPAKNNGNQGPYVLREEWEVTLTTGESINGLETAVEGEKTCIRGKINN